MLVSNSACKVGSTVVARHGQFLVPLTAARGLTVYSFPGGLVVPLNAARVDFMSANPTVVVISIFATLKKGINC